MKKSLFNEFLRVRKGKFKRDSIILKLKRKKIVSVYILEDDEKMLKSKRTPILPPPTPEKKYEIFIDSEQCDGCELCLSFCPKDIIEISKDEFNSRMLHYAIVIKPEECAGCRQCERLCPTVSLYILETDIKEVNNSE